jgi:hypothetical protein
MKNTAIRRTTTLSMPTMARLVSQRRARECFGLRFGIKNSRRAMTTKMPRKAEKRSVVSLMPLNSSMAPFYIIDGGAVRYCGTRPE